VSILANEPNHCVFFTLPGECSAVCAQVDMICQHVTPASIAVVCVNRSHV